MAQDQYGNYIPGLEGSGQNLPAGGSGVGAVYQTAGNPEGVQTSEAAAIAYDPAGGLYVKMTGSGNTGWETRINPAS